MDLDDYCRSVVRKQVVTVGVYSESVEHAVEYTTHYLHHHLGAYLLVWGGVGEIYRPHSYVTL